MSGNLPKILFVNHWARQLGGAELSLLDILSSLRALAQVHLVTSEPGALVQRAEQLGVTCTVLPARFSLAGVRRGRLVRAAVRSFPALISFAGYVLRAWGLVRRLRPDLVHANVPKSHMTLLLLTWLGYRGGRVLHMREIFPRKSLARQMYRLFTGGRLGAIAISEAVRANLPRNLRTRATVLYNGVAVPSVRTAPPADDAVRFVYLGRVVPWKGCHLLIDALAQARALSGAAPLSLSIVGDTLYWDQDYRERLRQRIAATGLDSCCTLLAHTDRPYDELQKHHVFCSASYQEPFGRNLAEAQAAGLPVVAFAGGGVGEVVEHGASGLVVPYGDTMAFARAMALFVRSPELIVTMGGNARERVERLFNVEKQAPLIAGHLLLRARTDS